MPKSIKAIYDLITTFAFVMVVVFIVISVLYLGKVIKAKTMAATDEANKYEDVTDAKDRILSKDCHGAVIDEATANVTCVMPAGKIRGYIIQMPVYGNCTDTPREWKHVFSDLTDGDEFVYFVSIKNNESLICPGKLKVVH